MLSGGGLDFFACSELLVFLQRAWGSLLTNNWGWQKREAFEIASRELGHKLLNGNEGTKEFAVRNDNWLNRYSRFHTSYSFMYNKFCDKNKISNIHYCLFRWQSLKYALTNDWQCGFRPEVTSNDAVATFTGEIYKNIEQKLDLVEDWRLSTSGIELLC